MPLETKKKQVSHSRNLLPSHSSNRACSRLLVRNYNKLRALSPLYQQERRFAGSACPYGSIELGDRHDGLAVYLDDDIALLETGSRGSRVGVDIGDDDALRAFGSLELLTKFRR